LDLNQR